MNLPFKKGEKVVYPAHGVAVIEDIQSRVISGTERRFYMLKILGTEKMTIMIPTENVTQVGLRRVIGKDVVDKIYRILRTRKVLDTARSLLVKELSIAKAHPEEKIMEELKVMFAN